MSISLLQTKNPLLAGLTLKSNGITTDADSIIGDKTNKMNFLLSLKDSEDTESNCSSDSTGSQQSVIINGLAHTLSDKRDLIMHKLTKFYEDPSNLERMLDVVEGRSKVSLRLLDWLITNYAKKNDIIYGIQKGDSYRQFMVYSNYRAQLKAYSKNLFDPFCRHERIKFKYGDDKIIRTTIGQLNFFKWCIENLVLDYADDHYEEVTEDMKCRGRLDESQNKKKELSISATKTISTHDVKIVVKFD